MVILKIEYRLSRRRRRGGVGGGGGGGVRVQPRKLVLLVKRLNQTEFPIFVILCVLCFQKAILFDFYFGVVPCGGHKKSSPISS